MNEQTVVCPKCGGALKKIWSSKRSKHYWACQSAEEVCGSFFPDAGGTPKLPAKRGPALEDMPCPKCTAPMQKVESSVGVFYSCSKYPSCDYTIDISPTGELAPLCPSGGEDHGHMKLRRGKNGQFWSCRSYLACGCNATREIDGRPTKKKSST